MFLVGVFDFGSVHDRVMRPKDREKQGDDDHDTERRPECNPHRGHSQLPVGRSVRETALGDGGQSHTCAEKGFWRSLRSCAPGLLSSGLCRRQVGPTGSTQSIVASERTFSIAEQRTWNSGKDLLVLDLIPRGHCALMQREAVHDAAGEWVDR